MQSNRLYVIHFIGVDQNIVKIYNNKDIKFFYQNLVDITLKTCRNIRQAKQHDLVLKIAIPGLKSRFLFVSFSNLHLMICTGQVKLCKIFSLTSPIQRLTNQGQKIQILNGQVIKTSVIDTQLETSIKFLNKEDKSTYKELERLYEIIG